MNSAKTPEATRRKILDAAFMEFYVNGFQAGSLNRIVTVAGITKGALFHHFESKQALGYADLDELIGPLLMTRWLEPIDVTNAPIPVLQRLFRRYVAYDIDSGNWHLGCPLNNLAQEMAPLDLGFQQRISRLYERWREHYAAAIERGIDAGNIKASVSPANAAALIVAGQMGIWGSAKSSRSTGVMRQTVQGVCDYLESLRAA